MKNNSIDFNKISFKKKVKILLYFFIFYSGLLNIFLIVFKKMKKEYSAVILVYHQIIDNNTYNYLYKSVAIHHHFSDFKAEMRFIKKWFNIISLDELVNNVKSNTAFGTPSIAITFDDGYRDNYTLAYPILKKLKFPATIYLITGLIGTHKRTWLDEVEYALLNSNVDSFKFPELFSDETINIFSLEDKKKANDKICKSMKYINNSKRLKLIDELFIRLNIKQDARGSENRRMLSWEEVKDMGQNNISFGAHTNSHPVLAHISFEEAKKEILLSKTEIENKLGVPIKHFTFPNGRDNDFNNKLKDYCMDLGFESVASAEHGAINKGSDPHYLLRFIPVIPLYIFAVELTRLFVFSKRYTRKKKRPI